MYYMTHGKKHNFIAEPTIASYPGPFSCFSNGPGYEAKPTIAEDVVVTKYRMAGDMANRKPAMLGVCNMSWKEGKRRASAIVICN